MSDPVVRQQALDSLDCTQDDPLSGHEDVNLPLVACGNGSKYVLDKALLTGKDVADAVAGKNEDGTAVVNLTLTDAARSIWAAFTTRNAGNEAAIVVGTSVVMTPTISGTMSDGFIQLSGRFDERAAQDIVRRITGR